MVSFRKRMTSRTDDKQTTAIEMEPLQRKSTAVAVDVPGDDVATDTPENTEAGWSSILLAIFKILVLGIAVFIYDIYSKLNDEK